MVILPTRNDPHQNAQRCHLFVNYSARPWTKQCYWSGNRTAGLGRDVFAPGGRTDPSRFSVKQI